MSKGLCLALRHQIHQGRHASVEVFLRRPRRHPEAVAIYADATLWAAQLLPGQTIRHELVPGRGAYLVAARGSYCIGDLRVQARDGLAVTGEPAVEIAVLEPLEVLLLELAMSQAGMTRGDKKAVPRGDRPWPHGSPSLAGAKFTLDNAVDGVASLA